MGGRGNRGRIEGGGQWGIPDQEGEEPFQFRGEWLEPSKKEVREGAQYWGSLVILCKIGESVPV